MIDPKYESRTADLNSLYNEGVDRSPVFAEDCNSYEDAVKARCEYQTNDTAAWIQNKETGEIVP